MDAMKALAELENFVETLENVKDMTNEERSTYKKLNDQLDFEINKLENQNV